MAGRGDDRGVKVAISARNHAPGDAADSRRMLFLGRTRFVARNWLKSLTGLSELNRC